MGSLEGILGSAAPLMAMSPLFTSYAGVSFFFFGSSRLRIGFLNT